MDNDLLLKRDFHLPEKWRVVQNSQIRTVLQNQHDKKGDFGCGKTHSLVVENVYWGFVYDDVC